jgi:hypothetical protein
MNAPLARSLLLLAALVLALPVRGVRAEPLAAPDAFARLQAVVGTWEMPAQGGALRVNYRLVSRDSALVETWAVGSGHETLTVFHLDGARLLATHYCAQGNQPRLGLAPESTPAHLVFQFADATNLASPEASHLHRLDFTLTDADHFTKVETYRNHGQNSADTLQFTRVRAGDS